jgi:hypothetical protein
MKIPVSAKKLHYLHAAVTASENIHIHEITEKMSYNTITEFLDIIHRNAFYLKRFGDWTISVLR